MNGMIVRSMIGLAMIGGFIGRSVAVAQTSQPAGVPVEPAELMNRADLIGREVIVDDRVRYFQFHPGEGYDEIQLKRTPVTFRLPRTLRPPSAPGNPAIQIRGLLKREGEQWVCDVSSFLLLPSDLDRLDQAVSRLASNDFASRKAWSDWGLSRAKAFDDKPLRERSLKLEGDALRIEADSLHDSNSPKVWLQLAEEARRRQVPEPEPSALAHKAFRARLVNTSTAQEMKALCTEIERFFPKSKTPMNSGDEQPGSWREEYAADPGKTYRKSSPEVRTWLDRRLWLDATEKSMKIAARSEPNSGLELAIRAETELPERPSLAKELSEIGIEAAIRTAANLRLSEVKEKARLIREQFKRPDKAETLLSDWLKIQRTKVSDSDADGLLTLATRYEELLNDRRTALDYIQRAWRADPASNEVAVAFRTRGYRRVGEEWVEDGSHGSTPPGARGDGSTAKAPRDSVRAGLKGLTPEEVRQKLGNKPDQVVYVSTKGRLVEQWIYRLPQYNQYVNFIRTPNELKPRVVSEYSLQRSLTIGLPGGSSGTSPPR